jgi:hypothetical protein
MLASASEFSAAGQHRLGDLSELSGLFVDRASISVVATRRQPSAAMSEAAWRLAPSRMADKLRTVMARRMVHDLPGPLTPRAAG